MADEDYVQFSRGDDVFVYALETGLVRQVADLRTEDDPADEDDDQKYVAEQQERLFDIVRLRKEREEARRDHARAERNADPTRVAAARLLRGRIFMMGGEASRARREFKRAVVADSALLSGHAYLAATYFVAGEITSGLTALDEMVRINPTVPAELRAIETLRRFGLDPQAEQWRKRARQRYPASQAMFEPDH